MSAVNVFKITVKEIRKNTTEILKNLSLNRRGPTQTPKKDLLSFPTAKFKKKRKKTPQSFSIISTPTPIIIMTEERSKIALVTGITGQDGSYLTELLLSKGYTVSYHAHAAEIVCTMLFGVRAYSCFGCMTCQCRICRTARFPPLHITC